MGNSLSNFIDQGTIVEFPAMTAIAPLRLASQTFNNIRARYTKDITDRLHWSSSGNEGERAIHFRDFMTSTASRNISFSIVFLPSSRCSSRTCANASDSSEAGTTSSPELTADKLPFWYSLRQPNN
jgi:hypothetical protein